MRTKIKSTVTAHLLLALALLTAGCGGEEGGHHGAQARREARARQVAEAWDGSVAARTWRAGYHPMGEAVQPPAGGFHAGADTRAFTTQNFVLRGTLPAAGPAEGKVRWRSGAPPVLPLTGAREAYGSVARGGNDGPHLTVTGARQGVMTLATSRGPATVPAWLFTLEGYDTPLKRAAVAPSKLPPPPIGPQREVSTSELAPLAGPAEVAGDGRSVTVTAGHGTCDDGPAVHVLETGGSVVLSAFVTGVREGPCASVMLRQKVTVRLAGRLGDRVLLDAFTGRPVPYGEPNGASPSWRR
ncbi:hypothetical protein OHB41_22750 [Streptomyces sp. NBC_01571]|uniref:hypothetical protein n=1 Tax=Streptomyces sp. NBC_01571 TaxID=2975883 RepID=UPI00225C2E39|nr:hypothetical protein [Streptomyces sp. NBC_01571]MCX4575961.1 hypothetical protein [Streptomyces sp. NBC_01571]